MTTYTIGCKDAGVECPFVAKEETLGKAVSVLEEHAQQIHAEEIKKLLETMSPEEMTEWLKKQVKITEE